MNLSHTALVLLIVIIFQVPFLSAMQRTFSFDDFKDAKNLLELAREEFADSTFDSDFDILNKSISDDSSSSTREELLESSSGVSSDDDAVILAEECLDDESFASPGEELLWLSFYGLIDDIVTFLDGWQECILSEIDPIGYATDQGYTALHAAAQQGHLDVVKLLISKGFNVNQMTLDGSTPLHLAAQECHAPVVSYLLRCDNLEVCRDSLGRSPLHLAAWKGHKNICFLLASAGNDINALAHCRITPLFAAIWSGKRDAMRELLRLKADPTISNAAGETPADCARNLGDCELAAELEKLALEYARLKKGNGSP